MKHVILVIEENTNYADICGPNNTSMVFLCSLKPQGSFSANYFAPTHPSIGNYNDLGWGVVTTNDDTCNPTTCVFPFTGNNIVRAVQAAGKTWKGYAESLPSTCDFGAGSGQYAPRHSPIPYISDVQSNCQNRYVAFEDANLGFAKDLANNTLPNFSFITPNLCDDGHDCTLPGSPIPDQWLQLNVIQPLQSGGHLDPVTGDTVLIVTVDESGNDNTNGGGAVYWFMMGLGVKQNYQSTGPSVAPGFYSHESTLRVIAELVGASIVGLGGAANAPDMTEFFTAPPTPAASPSPTSLTYASQTVGTASAAQTVTLTNSGGAALTISGISASGDFGETNNCGSSLAGGGNCSVNVTFTPTGTGTRTGSLSFTDNASGNPQTVTLSGTGAAPGMPGASAAPTSLTFASQTVGTTSAAQTVTLSNPGTVALTINGITANGNFGQTNNCGSSLGAGGNCSINVTFTPTGTGSLSGSVSVTSNATTSPNNISLSGTGQSAASGTSHYVYIVQNGSLQVFDMDNGHSLVKTVNLPGETSPLGLAASSATNMLYISYGGFGGSQGTGSMLEYNLLTDTVVYTKNYTHGVDSISITPDGKTIYLPDGENSGDTLVYVVDAATGNELSTIATGDGPHNTMMGLDGKKVYVGPRNDNNLYVIDTATNQVTLKVGPFVATNIVSGNGVRPFTINGKQTLSFTTESGFLGFQVGDLTTGAVLYTVVPTGFTWNGTGPSVPDHGISLSPDEKELYLLDSVNQVVHVYDITGLPGTAPQLVTSIHMGAAFNTVGWLQHSRDGRFVQVSDSGDVIDTATRTTTNTLPISSALVSSRWYIEVDFTNGVPSFGTFERGGPGYLTGTQTPAPVVNLSSSSLTYASQNLNTTSAAQTVTLTNTGNAALNITSIGVTGTNSGDFGQTNNCGSSVAANNGNCTINVTFTPTATGARAAAVTITDNATGSPHTITLSGTGAGAPAPGVSFSAQGLTYASQTLNTTSAAQTVTLTNTGNAALSIGSLGITGANSGDFAQTNNCSSSVAANNGNCTINVTFTPTATGARAAAVTLTDNATGSPQSFTLSGTGAGAPAPGVSLSAASLTFASQQLNTSSGPQSVTLTNTGNAALNITSIGVTGANSGDFAQTNNCGSSVAANNGNCTINVTFTPTATGARGASVTITDNAAGSPHSFTLSGTGTTTPAPTAILSASSLTFGGQTVNTTSGSQSVTLTNTGNAALTITSIGVTGTNSGDFAQTNNCGSSVAANNGNCTINVTFTPTAAGARGAAVTITDNAAGSPRSVSLAGTGLAPGTPGANLSPASLTFASQTISSTSAAQTVTLSNSGSAALTITGIAASGDFGQSNNCGSSLAAGGNCSISVKFTPTAAGTRTGSLSVTDNASGSPQTVSLTGTGAAAGTSAASVSPTSLTFASQTLNSTSAAQTVTLSNSGSAALTITGIAANGDFGETNNCGSSLAAGGNCSISVTFTPTAAGTRTGALTVTDNASGSPQNVTLTGTGANGTVDFSLTATAVTGTVTAGQPAKFNLTVTSSGGFNQAVNLTCSGAPQGAACIISPSSVTPSGSGPTTTTITVTTTAHVMVGPGPREVFPTPGGQMVVMKMALLMGILAMLATTFLGKRRQARLVLGFTMLVVLLGSGCLGLTGSSPLGPGTPVGTYILTVTGQSGTGSNVLVRTVKVTLVVN
ncbi:MAG TPA: choice-of-anchor D domain-containing protein [Candidatus Acidoferrales bacterium]|nr:choice-of-anchor D domain-containing protein [Candidatus Acidoferrales bacterium]